MQQDDIAAEMERARLDFRHLLGNATSAELRAATDGTRWTNEQLLFHMLFGYLLVHNLLILVKAFARLPRRVSKAFAATLNAATRPFHVVNYVGSLGGARVLGRARMERLVDFAIGRMQRSVLAASEVSLNRGMHFPVGWDPYFNDFMTLREIYHYPTQHYDHHRRQLTLTATITAETGSAGIEATSGEERAQNRPLTNSWHTSQTGAPARSGQELRSSATGPESACDDS